MSFNYLLLGHLIGDFTLQTGRIASNKTSNCKWNLLHAVIVTIAMLFFSIPFGLKTMGLVLINGITHYCIDSYKSRLLEKSPIHTLANFIVDQALHIAIIFLISNLGEKEPYILFVKEEYLKPLVVLVFIISFMSIFIQYCLKVLFPSYSKILKGIKPLFMKHEKIAGEITRLLVFLTLFLSYWLSSKILIIFIPIMAALSILFYKSKWSIYISKSYIAARLSADLFIPIAGFYFLIYVYI